jgi:hypothetical protein
MCDAGCCRHRAPAGEVLRFGWMFMVYLAAYSSERRTGVSLCLESESDSDDFEGVGKEDGGDARQRSRGEAASRRFAAFVWYNHGSDLFISQELDSGIWEDSKEGGRMSAKQSSDAILRIDVSHGGCYAKPAPCIFRELRIRGLKEDLDSI